MNHSRRDRIVTLLVLLAQFGMAVGFPVWAHCLGWDSPMAFYLIVLAIINAVQVPESMKNFLWFWDLT